MSIKQPTIIFNNGKICPLLGLGTFKCEPKDAANVIKDAIDIGYRHFDCAHYYQNEKEVGIGLKEKINKGSVKREDLFITSKLWNTYHKNELVIPAIRRSLENLGLNYLDLYLIHSPMGLEESDDFYPVDSTGRILHSNTHFIETWKAMEECVKLGLTKSIGLSNFNSKQVQEILDIATIKPVNNQVECHPYLNQSKLIQFCKDKGIAVAAYSPLGSPYRPLLSDGATRLLDDAKVLAIANKHGKTVGQILIRYQIQRQVIVIPKSSNKERIKNNFEAINFRLEEEDMTLLNSLDRPNGRMVPFANLKDHKDYPFNLEY